MPEFFVKADVDETTGKITKIYNKSGLDQEVKGYAGKSIKLSVAPWRKKRSLPQLRYYWGCLIPQVIEGLIGVGYSKAELDAETVHIFLKSKFLVKEIVSEDTGDILKLTRSTGDLSTLDMNEFFDEIAQWCAEYLQITLLMPNEQATMDL